MFYEPVYEHLVDTDPVTLMADGIDFSESEGESIRAFSGFRGIGKTTELLRLQKRMEERGFLSSTPTRWIGSIHRSRSRSPIC